MKILLRVIQHEPESAPGAPCSRCSNPTRGIGDPFESAPWPRVPSSTTYYTYYKDLTTAFSLTWHVVTPAVSCETTAVPLLQTNRLEISLRASREST
jgi:hypothetical protein